MPPKECAVYIVVGDGLYVAAAHELRLKRFNMALRWLVRSDGIVDIGCWKALAPSQLFIPLDVHSASTARSLGLFPTCPATACYYSIAHRSPAMLRLQAFANPGYYP